MESAVIVDVDADDNETRILASGSMSETSLKPGRNILPAELWKKSDIQFSARGSDSVQVFPERQSVQMSRGSVQYVNVKTVKTFTLVGMLQDEQGKAVKNRYVRSDVGGSIVNAEGVLTLDTGVANRLLTVQAENGLPSLQCVLPSGLDKNKKVQFISAVRCQIASTVEK
jgi:outer membrane usher protein FimD/PapC